MPAVVWTGKGLFPGASCLPFSLSPTLPGISTHSPCVSSPLEESKKVLDKLLTL